MSFFETGAGIAAKIGCSPQHISSLKTAGKIPSQFIKKEKRNGKLVDMISTDFVKWYQENHTRQKPGPPSSMPQGMQAEKLKAEVSRLILQAKKLNMEIEEKQGIYVLKSDYEKALAERATIFRQDLESMARAKSHDIVSIAGGDPEKVPDVIDYILKLVYKFLERYCN